MRWHPEDMLRAIFQVIIKKKIYIYLSIKQWNRSCQSWWIPCSLWQIKEKEQNAEDYILNMFKHRESVVIFYALDFFSPQALVISSCRHQLAWLWVRLSKEEQDFLSSNNPCSRGDTAVWNHCTHFGESCFSLDNDNIHVLVAWKKTIIDLTSQVHETGVSWHVWIKLN